MNTAQSNYALGFSALLLTLLALLSPTQATAQELIQLSHLDDADATAVARLIDTGADVNSKHI